MTKCRKPLGLWAVCLCVWTASAQPPPLPTLKLDSFAPHIRAQVQQAYERAQARPQEAEAQGQLGMVLHAYVQYEGAALCYARARYFAPQEFRWLYYEAVVQAALGRHHEAAQTLQRASLRQPDDLPTQLKRAEALLASGQTQVSAPLFARLTKQKATRAAAHYGLGQIKSRAGKLSEAIAHYRQAIADCPEFGAAHYALGQALRDQRQTAAAKEHLALSQRYKFQRPALADPLLAAIAERNLSATDLLAQGAVLDSQGKLLESIAAHERALEIYPQLVQAHINLIALYARAGRLDKAETHYQTAIAMNPHLADSYFNYGVVLLQAGRAAEAAVAFQRSLTCNPFNAEAQYNYGAIIEREGKLDEAATHFQQALANNPDHRQARFHWARILVHQDKLREAIAQFSRLLLPEDDETPRFIYALGATYARAGDKANAWRYLHAARELALKYKQPDLAALIERDLSRMK